MSSPSYLFRFISSSTTPTHDSLHFSPRASYFLFVGSAGAHASVPMASCAPLRFVSVRLHCSWLASTDFGRRRTGGYVAVCFAHAAPWLWPTLTTFEASAVLGRRPAARDVVLRRAREVKPVRRRKSPSRWAPPESAAAAARRSVAKPRLSAPRHSAGPRCGTGPDLGGGTSCLTLLAQLLMRLSSEVASNVAICDGP